MFIGRENEIKQINKSIKSDKEELILIYGRRRIGKSELIKNCLKNTNIKSIFFECRQTNEKQNLDFLCEIVAKVFNLPGISFSSIERLLDFLFNKAIDEPIILVLDEYPHLKRKVDGIDSIIQALFDHYKDISKLKIILCGSYIDVMKQIVESSEPLFGRVTLLIYLKQMDYYDTAKFYESFSNKEKVILYSVFGGIPYYNSLIDKEKSVKENIINLIASNNSRLEVEINFYLKNELNKLENANTILDVIAHGKHRFSDILSSSDISSSPTLVDVLNKLIKMELIEKVTSIDKKGEVRKAMYYLKDNLTNFYYRYIFRNSSTLSIMNPDEFFKDFIEQDFNNQYVPKTFENIAKQFLIRSNIKGLIKPPFHKLGKYIYDSAIEKRNYEFDVVTLDKNGYICYEVKFIDKKINQEIINKEIKQIDSSDIDAYKYGFISLSGFDIENRNDLILYTIDDLFNDSLNN